MAYLITGGAGFIGSHVAERLLEQGEQVIIIDNFNDYYDPALKRQNIARLNRFSTLHLLEGDVRDVVMLDKIFANHDITHIAHLAAMAGVRASVDQTRLYMEVNLSGTMNLLEMAQQHSVKQFVFASTSSVYGETQTLPFVETDAADQPLAPYPASKRAAEILAHTYTHLFDLNVTVLRFFNVYGPSGRPDMMPLRLMDAAMTGNPITVFGTGSIKRDWTYIDDVVGGVLAALKQPLGYEVINIGYGSAIALSAFIEIVEDLSDRAINQKRVPVPASDPPITYCNNRKARELLGFTPQIDVAEGLARTWNWYKTAILTAAHYDKKIAI